jgi:ferredoxin
MPFDLRDPVFYDDQALDHELGRVFDICHGCRMCFNYCPSFPALFDAVDAHEERGEGEVAALTHDEKWAVVDLCYQCKICYVKCPYTPPHPLNVDFPRLMLRAKATRARREGVTRQDRFLGDPDVTARRSTGIVAPIVNWANARSRGAHRATVGIHKDRAPPFARETFDAGSRGPVGSGRRSLAAASSSSRLRGELQLRTSGPPRSRCSSTTGCASSGRTSAAAACRRSTAATSRAPSRRRARTSRRSCRTSSAASRSSSSSRRAHTR